MNLYLTIKVPNDELAFLEHDMAIVHPLWRVDDFYASLRHHRTHTMLIIDTGDEGPLLPEAVAYLTGKENHGHITFWEPFYPSREEEE